MRRDRDRGRSHPPDEGGAPQRHTRSGSLLASNPFRRLREQGIDLLAEPPPARAPSAEAIAEALAGGFGDEGGVPWRLRGP